MSDFLVLDNVSCGYGNDFNLLGISVSIARGKITGIVGPNGSGKSTLFKGMAGDLRLNTGTITLDGHNLATTSIRQRAQMMAVVSQFVDNSDITVHEYVLLGRMPYRKNFQFFETEEDLALAEHYMRLTDTYRHRDKAMAQLSGGEQQLAAVARALTQQPKLLLLDEPTSHLDIMHQMQILNLVHKLSHDTELTVLLIIHDLNLASEFCDQLVMMHRGSIHTHGTPDEVLNFRNIEDVYKTVVLTQQNPMSGKPTIFLVSDRVMEETKKTYDIERCERLCDRQ